jgi:aryl-alcohol dehydrogenase-like predicted oxidoreductase
MEGYSTMIPKRKLGSTPEHLSIIGLGAIALMGQPQEDANAIVANAVERGINYFDVAPSYGAGQAEETLGPAMQPFRDGVFLACKTGARTADKAQAEMEKSLERLKTDHFDLYQVHGLCGMEELDTLMSNDGAIHTFIKAREQGITKYIGFSAHSEEVAIEAMSRFDFDSVLFPLNCVCYHKSNFGPAVVKAANGRGMGVLSLKAMARRPWPEGVHHDQANCWYQPFTDPENVDLAIRFALSEPLTAVVPPGDVGRLAAAIEVGERFIPLADAEREKVRLMCADEIPIFPHFG